MKKMSKILCIIVTIYSIYLALTSPFSIYGTTIKLSVIPIIYFPKFLNKLFKLKTNETFEIVYILFIFSAHFLGSIVNLYQKVYWYDSFAHFLSGIVVAYLATYILVLFKKYDKKSVIFNILFILGISFLVAGMWEIFEYTSDHIFNKDAQNVLTTGVNDTMKDIIVAALGTLLYCILYLYEELENKYILVKKFIKSI